MRIENEKIQLWPLNLLQIKKEHRLPGQRTRNSLTISDEQIGFLEFFLQSSTIQQAVKYYYENEIFPSFIAVRQMIEFMVSENIIQNKSFHDYFSVFSHQPGKAFEEKTSTSNNEKTLLREQLRKLPFLRSLRPEVFDLILQHARILETPAGVLLCQEGKPQRSLYALISGQASIFKKGTDGAIRKVAVLSPGSIFGETGFFLGEKRVASVMTDIDSVILQVKYEPASFDNLIKTQNIRDLQQRFWVIHSLLKSKLFSTLPDDCFDALIFSGEFRSFAANKIIFRENEPGDTCYIVVQGNLSVSIRGQSIRTLKQGDSFGELALIMTGGQRSATIETQSEVLVLEIPKNNFYKLLSENLMLACEFEQVANERIKIV